MSLRSTTKSSSAPIVLAQEVEETLLSRGFRIFLRSLAVVFLYLAVATWLTLVGFGDEMLRFDRVDVASRVYQAVLAVLFPVTAVGLWTTLPWGRVVWGLTILFQTGAAIAYPGLFPEATRLALFHAVTVVIFLVFSFGVPITTKNR